MIPVQALLVNTVVLIISMIVLLKGADSFLNGSVRIARHFGISELVVSLTLVAVATSLPEISISFIAALMQESPVSVSNIVGTTIFNTCLILGLTASLGRIVVHQKIIDRDSVALLISYLALLLFFWMGGINQAFGLAMILGYGVYLYYLYQHARTESTEKKKDRGLSKQFLLLLLGIIGVYLGSRFAVGSAVQIARLLGISSWVIGAIVLAGGSSLPELIVSLQAVRKGKRVMAVGTVIGSNVMDILLGLGVTSLVMPLTRNFLVIAPDLLFGLFSGVIVTLLLLKDRIDRKGGALLLLLYVSYMAYLVMVPT